MSEKKIVRVQGFPGFLTLLTLLFIGLKLTGHITWSWFWVLSPMIFGFTCVFVVLFLILAIAAFEKRRY